MFRVKAASCKSSGSQFLQTVGPATENYGFQRCCSKQVAQKVNDGWQIINIGDLGLHTLTYAVSSSDSKWPVHIGDTTVIPVSVVRDLGVYIDCCVTMSAEPVSRHSG